MTAPRYVILGPDGRYWDLGWDGWDGEPDWREDEAQAAVFTRRDVAEALAKRWGGTVLVTRRAA